MRSLILFFLICLSGCSANIQYATTPDSAFNFESLETFQIVSNRSGESVVRIHHDTAEQLDKLLASKLTALGYSSDNQSLPTFTASYRLEAKWDPRLGPDEKRQRLGFSGSSFPDADPRARNYQLLSLVIDIHSPSQNKLIWSGTATNIDYVSGGSGRALFEAAEGLLRQFPSRA